MTAFIIRFLTCSLAVTAMIGVLLAAKYGFRQVLSSRMQYHLWFLMLGLLAVPFLPVRSLGVLRVLSGIRQFFSGLLAPVLGNADGMRQMASDLSSVSSGRWIGDFGVNLSQTTPSVVELGLATVWLAGVLVTAVLVVHSRLRLRRLRRSAVLLQNPEVKQLYRQCLSELHIRREIPIYGTMYLSSPAMAGCLKPCIYLPIRLVSDCDLGELRYMLLHELQHYRCQDAWAGCAMDLARILYWFHPLVWYALGNMKQDRELACDTAVLQMLEQKNYHDYGLTLIHFAGQISGTPFSCTSGIGGNAKQMRRRIANIASYQTPSRIKTAKGLAAFGAVGLLLACFLPALAVYGADDASYSWDTAGKQIVYEDFSGYFGDYDGSFVLYDAGKDGWTVYNRDGATRRSSPYSTFKIYDALMGLEAGVISPLQSKIAWNGEHFPIEAWNGEQDLTSAMSGSVNWYFQAIDEAAGFLAVKNFVNTIGYGNRKLTGDSPSFWLNSDLKISPVEQVELLEKLDSNDFSFAEEHVRAVKDSIRLEVSSQGTMYGKTGTGKVEGENTDGWFVGYVERDGGNCYFAVSMTQGNSTANAGAGGSAAADIARKILSELEIWK